MENAVRTEIIHYRLCLVLKVNVTKNTLAAFISQLENVTMCPGLPVDRRVVGGSENLGVPNYYVLYWIVASGAYINFEGQHFFQLFMSYLHLIEFN